MSLIDQIEELKGTEVSEIISERIKEFEGVEDLFSELCFCLMTAGFRAEKCIEIQAELGNGIRELEMEEVRAELKRMGHRFWPQRGERIFRARVFEDELGRVREEGDRDWLIENIYGMGIKEASHFLRNVGKFDFAIVDFHIVDLLRREGLIGDFGGLNRGRYIEVEEVLRELAMNVELSLGELDLYLWYLETGTVLK